MKLYHTFFMSTAIILGLATGAAQLTPYENRYNTQQDSYGRLLSQEYQKIANLESRAGTYDNIEFFKEQSERAVGTYNPRPMTLKGLGNTDSHLQELLQMRVALDRAMVGYAMRHNPSAVAGMHASFECRLKNVNINRKIDDICKKEFNKYAKQAEESANPTPSSPVSMAIPPEPIMQNPIMPEPVVSAPVAFEPVAPPPLPAEVKPVVTPVTPVPIASKSVVTPVPVTPVPVGKIDYIPETENFTNSFVPHPPKVPVSAQQQLPPPVEPLIESVPSIAPATTPQQQNKVLITEPAETFDPLEHIHPSLRNKIRHEQEMKQTVPNASSEQTPTPIPEYKSNTIPESNPPIPQEEFGIKPLSEVKKPTLDTSSLQYNRSPMDMIPSPRLETMTR